MAPSDVLLKPERCVMSLIHFHAGLAADSSLAGGTLPMVFRGVGVVWIFSNKIVVSRA